MAEFLAALADYRFLQYALLACVLASIGCGSIGVYVVVKRIGFVAGGIAHSVLAGMGVAFALGAAPATGAILSALFAAILIGMIRLRWRQHEDTLVAAVWSTGMAIGVLCLSSSPGYTVDLAGYLFGNILLVSTGDLWLMVTLDAVLLAALGLFHRQFLATAFDEEFARVRGINVEFFYLLLLCIVALTVVLLIRIVGLILVMALLVLPAATAARFVVSATRMMLLATAVSLAVTCSGLVISFVFDLPAGATMVLVAALAYGVSLAAGGARLRAAA